jgi:hypothetical protein
MDLLYQPSTAPHLSTSKRTSYKISSRNRGKLQMLIGDKKSRPSRDNEMSIPEAVEFVRFITNPI